MKLKRYEINELFQVLKHQLNGRAEVAKNGDGKEIGIVVKPFDFEPDARYALAKTLRKITGIVEDIGTVQNAILAEEKDGQAMEAVQLKARAYMLADHDDDVPIHLVNKSDLKMDTNKLPPSVIAPLLLMCREEQEES